MALPKNGSNILVLSSLPKSASHASINNSHQLRRRKNKHGRYLHRGPRGLADIKVPDLSPDEVEWIEYVIERVQCIFAFEDGYVQNIGTKHTSINLVHSMAQDLKTFPPSKSFKSNETLAWDLQRILTVNRIQKRSIEIIGIREHISDLLNKNEFSFNYAIRRILQCLYVECSIYLYDMLDTLSTTPERIGITKNTLENIAYHSYEDLLLYADDATRTARNPKQSIFLVNSFIFLRVAALIESRFMDRISIHKKRKMLEDYARIQYSLTETRITPSEQENLKSTLSTHFMTK